MKKWIIILLLFLSSNLLGQIIGRTKPGRFFISKEKSKIETLAPEIIIKKPIFPSGDIILNVKLIEFYGVVKDQYGLKSLEINDSLIEYSDSGEFYHEIALGNGKQVITIKAINNENQTSIKEFKFRNNYVPIMDYTPEVVIVIPPPNIELEEPILNENNYVQYAGNKITIQGNITDSLGIDEVLINNFNIIHLLQDDHFSMNIGLIEGENKFEIIATNKKGKSSNKSFVVNYDKLESKPLIVISKPEIENEELIVEEEKLLISGSIKDTNKISSLKINNSVVQLLSGEFIHTQVLNEGNNTIIIEAINSLGNKSEESFEVKYIIPITRPLLSIIDPLLNNDNTYETTENIKLIRGSFSDKYGVEELKINDSTVSLNDSNEFSTIIELSNGVNEVLVSAKNVEGKSSSLSFKIIYTPKIKEEIADNSESRLPIIKTDSIKIDSIKEADKKFINEKPLPQIEIANTEPIINIIEPLLNENEDFKHLESIITIHGKVEDKLGLSNVIVNNQITTLLNDNEFFINLKLNQGTNNINIKATSMNGTTAEKNFKIITPIDIDGPKIVLLEPKVQRGFKIVRKSDVIDVKGTVEDISGVLEVFVNKRRLNLTQNNEFSTKLYLSLGDNSIIVKAVDNKLNVTQDTFIVNRKVEDIIQAGKYYAFVIGIDSYDGKYWSPLENAVNDAFAFKSVIEDSYKFDEIFTLYDSNATRRNIIQQFEWFTNNVTRDDNVLVFYAGHGQFKRELNKGYWVPVDAKSNSIVDFVSNNEIKTLLSAIPSRHTLLISDACFAGDILRGKQTESIKFDPNDMSKYFKEVYRKPSRLALTSGALEQVSDAGKENHSIFSYFLLKALKENNSKYLDVSQLFNEFRVAVINNSDQTPQLQVIRDTNDEGGQFVFIKK